MKKSITLLTALLITLTSLAQQGINYKALIKDDNGNILANQDIKVRFIIEEADGSNEYVEVHEVTTDANGRIILNIGEGTPGQFNDFNEIDWAAENYYLQVGIDPELDGSYVNFDATEFKKVPYALHANKADFATAAESATFKTINNVTSNSPGDIAIDDFVFGSTQLDATSNVTESNRLFFNKGKGAFRAGTSGNNEWNDTNVGIGSFASGENTTASALTSTAMGYNTTASQIDATALGTSTTASGISSLSAGSSTKAEAYASTAIGRYNDGGGNPTSWEPEDPLFEIGIGDSNTHRWNALTVFKNGNANLLGNLLAGSVTVGSYMGGEGQVSFPPGTIYYDADYWTFYGHTDLGPIKLGSIAPKSIVIPSSAFRINVISDFSISNDNFAVYSPLYVSFNAWNYQVIGDDFEYFLVAPLSLPVNATITKVTYVFIDNEVNVNYNFKIIKDCSLTSESLVLVNDALFTVQSPDYSTGIVNLSETIGPNCQYTIIVQLPTTSNSMRSGFCEFSRAIIEYTEE